MILGELVEVLIDNFKDIISFNFTINDRIVIILFLWPFLCFPYIMFSFKILLRKKGVHNMQTLDAKLLEEPAIKKISKFLVRGNTIFGLYLIFLAVYLFIISQPNMPITQILANWGPYLFIFGLWAIGILIFRDSSSLGFIIKWLRKRYSWK